MTIKDLIDVLPVASKIWINVYHEEDDGKLTFIRHITHIATDDSSDYDMLYIYRILPEGIDLLEVMALD